MDLSLNCCADFRQQMLEYIVYRTEHAGADGAADSATPEAMQRHLS